MPFGNPPEPRPCACIGPQPGQTLCPCSLARGGDKDLRIAQLEERVRQLEKQELRRQAMDTVFGGA